MKTIDVKKQTKIIGGNFPEGKKIKNLKKNENQKLKGK